MTATAPRCRRRALQVRSRTLVAGEAQHQSSHPPQDARRSTAQIGFTGGMCIDDTWLGNARNAATVARNAGARRGPGGAPDAGDFRPQLAADGLVPPPRRRITSRRSNAEGRTSAMCYKSGPGEGAESARTRYLFAIAAARKIDRYPDAYFVPDDLAIEMLLEACERGVRIRVIMPANNDSRFGRAASRSRWGRLLAPASSFTNICRRCITQDDGRRRLFVTVGSANFDNRSFSINDEVYAQRTRRAVAGDHPGSSKTT